MHRGSRRLSPIGSNMNDAGYPFRGPYKLDSCINHGHSGVRTRSRHRCSGSAVIPAAAASSTLLAIRVSGSHLRVEHLHATHDAQLHCALGVDAGEPRPVQASLLQATALVVPDDGHDYHLTTTVVPPSSSSRRASSAHVQHTYSATTAAATAPMAQHTCRLTLHNSGDGALLRIRAPRRGRHASNGDDDDNDNNDDGADDDDKNDEDDDEDGGCGGVQLLVDGQPLRAEAGYFAVPTSARDCRLVVRPSSRPRRRRRRAARAQGTIAIEAVPSTVAEQATLWCPGSGQDVELHAHEPAVVPVYEGGVYRLLLPPPQPQATLSSPQPQPQQPQTSVVTSTLMLRWCKEAAEATATRVYAPATHTIRVEDVLRVDGGGSHNNNNGGGAAVRGDVGVRLDGSRMQRVIIEPQMSQTAGGGAEARVVLDVDALQPVSTTLQLPPPHEQQLPQQQQQPQQPQQQQPPTWVAQLADALRAPSAHDAEQRLQNIALPPNDADAACIVNYICAQVRRPPPPAPPLLSLAVQSDGVHNVHCSSSSSSSHGSDDVYDVVTDNSSSSSGVVSLTVQRRQRNDASAPSRRAVVTCRVQLPPPSPPDDRGDAWLVAQVVAALQRGSLDTARVAEELSRIDVPLPTTLATTPPLLLQTYGGATTATQLPPLAVRSVAGQVLLPLLVQCLRHVQSSAPAAVTPPSQTTTTTTAAAPQLYFTCCNGYVDDIYTEQPHYVLRARIVHDDSAHGSVAVATVPAMVVPQHGRVPALAHTTLSAQTQPHTVVLTAHDAYTDEVRSEVRVRIMGAATTPATSATTMATSNALPSSAHTRKSSHDGAVAPAPTAAAAAAATPFLDVTMYNAAATRKLHVRLMTLRELRIVCDTDSSNSSGTDRDDDDGGKALMLSRSRRSDDDAERYAPRQHSGMGDVTVRLPASQPHHLAVSLYDVQGHCVLQQRLQLPAYAHSNGDDAMRTPPQRSVASAAVTPLLRWDLTLDDEGSLAVAADRRCVVRVAADGDDDAPLHHSGLLALDAEEAHEVRLRKQLRHATQASSGDTDRYGSHGHGEGEQGAVVAAQAADTVGEVLLRLPAWLPPRVLRAVATHCRTYAAGRLTREQLRRQCTRPTLRELLAALHGAFAAAATTATMAAADSHTSALPRSATSREDGVSGDVAAASNSVSSRVFFRLTGAD